MGEEEPQPGLSAHGWLDGAEDRLRGNNGGSQFPKCDRYCSPLHKCGRPLFMARNIFLPFNTTQAGSSPFSYVSLAPCMRRLKCLYTWPTCTNLRAHHPPHVKFPFTST